jgi:hypothetical protein
VVLSAIVTPKTTAAASTWGFRRPDLARDDAGAGDRAVHPEVRSRFGRQDRCDGTTRDLPHVQVDPLRPLRNPSFRFW